jgi:hypothetical protein
MDKLTIIDLDVKFEEDFEIHATGCADIAKKRGIKGEVADLAEALSWIDNNGLGYTIEDHCKVFPCVRERVGA